MSMYDEAVWFRLMKLTACGATLVALYLLCWLATLVQCGRVARTARLRSYHGALLALTATWLPMRVVVLLTGVSSVDMSMTGHIARIVLTTVYAAPTALQFASFSLWGLFLHGACQKRLGMSTTSGMVAWYATSTALLSAAVVAEVVVDSVIGHDDEVAAFVRQVQNGFRGFVYVVLTIIIAVYGTKFARLPPSLYHRTLLPSKPVVLHIVNAVLASLFFSRAVYDFVSLGPWQLPSFPPVGPATLAFFGVVEIMPLVVLLLVLRVRVSRRRRQDVSQAWEDRLVVSTPDRARSRSSGSSSVPPIVAGSGASAAMAASGPLPSRFGPVYTAPQDRRMVLDGGAFGDEADLLLYATDESVRQGFGTSATVTTGTTVTTRSSINGDTSSRLDPGSQASSLSSYASSGM